IESVVAAADALGVRAGEPTGSPADATTLTISTATVAGITGDGAAGLEVRTSSVDALDAAAPGPSGESIGLLDVTVTGVRARQADRPATGLTAAGTGSVDVRGVTVTDVEGDVATGLRILTGGAATLSGGLVDAVAGGAGGAVGARIEASASPRAVVVDEVSITGVHAVGHADAVSGLDILAPVSESAIWVDESNPPGPVEVTGCALARISGTAVTIDGDLRDTLIRGVEVYAAARAASVRAERVIVAETTWHRLQQGLAFGSCSLTMVSSLVTGVADGPAVEFGPETEVALVRAVHAQPRDPAPLLAALPDGTAGGVPGGLPYVAPGPDGVPPALAEGRALPPSAVDLRLVPGSPLHAEAVPAPADPPDRQPHLGAHPPLRPPACDLRDPLEPPLEPVAIVARPQPVLDRLARDGRGLLGVMQTRAATALPGWVPGDPADLTTTILELVANRLDRLSHRQDAALAEASLASARLRRSVEAHARLADHHPDPGLSATTMIELVIPPGAFVALGLADEPEPGRSSPRVAPFVLAADSVVVNRDGTDAPVLVSTEDDLVWRDSLAEVTLAEPVHPGQITATLVGDLVDLAPGRWLILQPDDVRLDPHVVRVTLIERGVDTTLVRWDPRRPAPPPGFAAGDRVLANVVPAHHGLRVGHRSAPALVDDGLAGQLEELATVLTVRAATSPDEPVELPLPLASASRVAPGWPFPGGGPRSGDLDVAVEVDGEMWRLVDETAVEPGEVFSVVPAGDWGSVARLGQPGSFTGRPVDVTITSARVGAGPEGNVAPHTLTSLVALGHGSTVPANTTLSELRQWIRVDNPVAGRGGRGPDSIERIRRAAPWTARRPVTAVTRTDYETLLAELDEVAGARARVENLGERRLVRVTVLLADEDTLVARAGSPDERGDVDPIRDAERLRRWALVRRRLEEIRLLGFDVALVPPRFVPLDLDVVVDAAPWAPAETLHRAVVRAIAGDGGLLDPDRIGLGGDVHVDGILRSVLAVTGVGSARITRLRRLEGGAVEYAIDGTLPIGPEEVAVIRRPYGDGADGLLTVEVCGGIR
ncbi:MAG: hypothetical protein ACK5RL_06600, partial [Acidimicrobiales bacterium]